MSAKIALLAAASVFWLAVVEGAARVYLRSRGDALDWSRPLLTADQELGWRQRANLDREFLGTRVRTNAWGWRVIEDADSDSVGRGGVLLLGPSSTFGWGVEGPHTYAGRLQEMLGSRQRVLNGGQIGYSTEQGKRLLARVFAMGFKPALIVFAYGVNDVDRARFYFQSALSDSLELAKSHSVTAANLMFSFAALNLTVRLGSAYHQWASPGAALGLGEADTAPIRVGPEEFSANLRFLAEESRRHGAVPLFLTSVYNLPADWRRPASANEEAYRSAARAVRERDFASARRHLAFARDTEPARVERDIAAYNELVRRAAVEAKVPVGDVANWFAGRDAQRLFVDPVHPSAVGHELIASGIMGLIRELRLE